MTDEPDNQPLIDAYSIQQGYCEKVWSYNWDEFKEDEMDHLKRKIAYAFCGEPNMEVLECVHVPADPLFGYSDDQKIFVLSLYEKIIPLCKFSFNGKMICMSTIYACVVPYSKDSDLDGHSYIKTKKMFISAVIKIRKCIKRGKSDKPSCCVYIDEHGRQYSDWNDYLTNNKLPEGILILPKNGNYTWDNMESEERCVQLQAVMSPASTKLSIAKNYADNASLVAGVGATGVFLTALFAPVAAPIMAGAVITSIATGVYGASTSSVNLADRGKHGQSVGLRDPEARGCWINIAASATSVVTGVASKVVASSVKQGAVISQATKVFFNTAVLGTMLTSTAGITNSLHTIITNYIEHKRTPSKLEIFQLTSSILFFSHSVVNFKLASTFIEETQISEIDQFKGSLRSNRHRKQFDKMAAETRRQAGDTVKGNAEVIRSLNNINDKDSFFASALRMNKELNKNKIRIAFNEDGTARLNTQHKVIPQDLISLSADNRSNMFKDIGPSQLKTPNAPVKMTIETPGVANAAKQILFSAKSSVAFIFCCEEKNNFINYIHPYIEDFAECFHLMYNLVQSLIELLTEADIDKLRTITDDVFSLIFEFVHKYLKAQTSSTYSIYNILINIFTDTEIRNMFLDTLLTLFKESLSERLPNTSEAKVCDACQGYKYAD